MQVVQRHRLHAPATDAQRIFHGRGAATQVASSGRWTPTRPCVRAHQLLPATDETEAQLAAIGQALAERWAVLAPGQTAELGLPVPQRGPGTQGAPKRAADGEVPDPQCSDRERRALQSRVHVLRGQNHGLFLDMAEGRRWVRQYAEACRQDRYGLKGAQPVCLHLRVFSGGIAGWGQQVVNVGHEPRRHGHGQQNHQLNGITTGASFLRTTFSAGARSPAAGLRPRHRDPPSYQRGSFVATKDYARLMRRLPDLLAPGGHALCA